jgi:hypothetical protein
MTDENSSGFLSSTFLMTTMKSLMMHIRLPKSTNPNFFVFGKVGRFKDFLKVFLYSPVLPVQTVLR